MADYHEDNISLSKALTMELPHVTRVWDVPGIVIQDKDLPENAEVERTFVMSHKNSQTTVGVMYILSGDKGSYIGTVAKYSKLDIKQLEKDFPSLFKLTGNLYAFG